jgi:hypothetical protein
VRLNPITAIKTVMNELLDHYKFKKNFLLVDPIRFRLHEPGNLKPTLLSLDPSLHDPHITVESTSCSTKEERDKGDDTFHTFCLLHKYKILLEQRIEINLLHATHCIIKEWGKKMESQEPRYHWMKARKERNNKIQRSTYMVCGSSSQCYL